MVSPRFFISNAQFFESFTNFARKKAHIIHFFINKTHYEKP